MSVDSKSIKKNILLNLILTSSNFVFPLITYAYVARVLLPEGTGKVAFVQAAIAYFGYVAALGISSYGTREAAKRRDNKEELSVLTQELLIINLISTAIAYVALFFVVLIIPQFHNYTILFAVMSLQFIFQTIGCEWLYKALEQYSYITSRSLMFKCISVFLTFLLIKSPDDYISYGFLTVFTTSASGIMNFWNLRKYITLKKFEHYEFKKHMRPIMVFFMSSIVLTIYSYFDSLMLGFIEGDATVGIYNAALKIRNIVLSVSTAVTSVLIPRMSVYYNQHDNDKIYDLLTKSVRVTATLMFPLSVFIILNASDILLFVCGERYLSAENTLIILMLCCLVLSLTNLIGNQILIPKGDEKRYSQSVFIGMWINLILNVIMIPIWSSAGAAFATLITECFNLYWMGRGGQSELRGIRNRLRIKQYLPSLTAACLCDVFAQMIIPDFPVFWRLVLNTCTFFGIYYILLIIKKEPLVGLAIGIIKRMFSAERK